MKPSVPIARFGVPIMEVICHGLAHRIVARKSDIVGVQTVEINSFETHSLEASFFTATFI